MCGMLITKETYMGKRKKIFNTKIKALRAEKNLTQQDLAIDLDVNRGTILEIERGTFNPSLKLACICQLKNHIILIQF